MEAVTVPAVQNLVSVVDGFCEDCRLRGLTVETVRRYRSSILLYTNHLASKGASFSMVDMEVLKGFLRYLKEDRQIKHKSVENVFSALSALYDYLTFEGLAKTNMVLPFRRRYLRRYKQNYTSPERRLLTVQEMSRLVNYIMDPRDRAILTLLAKTGVRRGEMLRMDVSDIDWRDYSIILKPTPKRSNRTVFFDDECALTLRRWLRIREKLDTKTDALLVSYNTLDRLSRNGAYNSVVKYARELGFHDPGSERLRDHFGPHCCRHWFTTRLLRNGMPREHVKELRGDARREAIDIYHHIDKQELRRTYLACIPKLGI